MGATRHTPIHSLTLSGNTAGALQLISSGTVTLAGGNNITLSQAGNAVTISGAAAAGAQTAISGISASDTLYTSGTVRITGVGGGVTVSSNTGQRVDISVAAPVAQSVQTQNVVDVTLSGNTAGALALISSGTMTLAGGNNITVSQAGNAVTISGPNVGGAQTGISGIANSETTYTSGTVSLSELGAITIRSTTGNQLQFSVNAQSVQPETQTFIAGVSASDTLYTSGNVRITGVGGGVTVSSNTGQRVDISVVAQSVQPETQTFIAGVSASDTLYTSGNVRITGVGGGVTVSSNTGQRVDISVAAQSVQPETQTFIAGVSASDTLYTSGNVRVTGVGGGITVSSNTGQRIDLSVAAPVAQTVQTQGGFLSAGVSTGGNTLGNTQVSTGSRLVFVGSGMITASQATAAGASTITLNATQSVQAETQTFIAGIRASDTTYTSGNVTFTGVGGGVTVSSNTGQRVDISVAAPVAATNLSVGVSTGGNTLGDTGVATGSRFVIVGSNGITASQGTAAGATTVTLSGVTQTVQTQGGFVSLGVSTGGNTAGNTQVSTGSRFVIVASGNLTASQATAAGASTVTLSVAAQTAQTGISGISNSNTTYTSGTVGLSELGAITIRSTTGNQFQFSVNSQTAQTQSNIQALYDGANSITTGTIRVTDANGVTFSVNGQTLSGSVNQSISMFAVSNTTQSSSGTAHKSALSFGGAGVASVGVTGGSVVISVPAGGGAGFSAGVSTGGNTAGATGISGTQLVLVGTNNISLSQTTGANGATVSISGNPAFSAGMSTEGNTAGNTGVTGTRLVLVGSGVMSLSQTTGAAGGTVSILAPATSSLSATGDVSISTNGSTISIGVPRLTLEDFQNFPQGQAALMTNIGAISKTPLYFNFNLPGFMTINSLAFKVSQVTANTLNSFSAHLGIYTFVNSTSMALLGSLSETYVVSSGSSVSFSGVRHYMVTGIGTHTALSRLSGGDYAVGMMFSAGATQSMNMSLMGASTANGPLGRIMPGVNQLSTGTSQGAQALWGRGSTTVNAMPANVVASELVNQGQGASMQLHPWIYIRS